MHVLFIADCDDRYGAAHSLLQMVRELTEKYPLIEASVVLPKGARTAEEFSKLGCAVYQIPYQPFYQICPSFRLKMLPKYPIRGAQYLFGRICGVRLLQKKLDISSVDLVHSNSSREDFSDALVQEYSKPLVRHIREYGDQDYSCYSYRKDYVGMINQTSTRCIAISDAVREHWIRKGIDPKKIIRIYNGVDSNVRKKRAYRQDPKEPMRFLMMGSISETKGQMQVIEAFARMPKDKRKQISIDIIGNGESLYCRQLKKKIQEFGIGSIVNLLGYCKDFYQDITVYDCGIMCSRSEGFGRVTAEYMMAGLPVIASDAGANPELVKDGKTGFLYKLNDAKDLAKKMLTLTEQPSLCEKMGRYAAQVAKNEFSSERNAERIYEVYQKVLEIGQVGGGNS